MNADPTDGNMEGKNTLKTKKEFGPRVRQRSLKIRKKGSDNSRVNSKSIKIKKK